MNNGVDVATRVGSGAIVLLIGEFALRSLGLITLLILARLLGPDDFGVIAAATFVLGLSEALTRLPLGAALIRHKQLRESHFNTAFLLAMLRAVVLSALIFASADLAAALFRDETIKPVLQWLALSPILVGLENPRFILFEKRLEFDKAAMAGVLGAAGGAAVAVVLALTLRNYWALVGSALTQRTIQVAMSYYWLPRRPGIGIRHWRDFLSFGGWLTGANIINYVNYNSDALIIGRFLGAATLGFYTFGNRIAEMITHELAAPFSRALYPGLAEVGKEPKRLSAGYLRAQSAILGIVLPAGMGTALIARELILVIGGDKWLPALPVIQYLAPVMAVGIVNAPITSLIMVTGETKRLFYRSMLNFLLRVPPMLIGIAVFGFMGIVYARVFSGLANTAVTLQLAERATGMAWWMPFLASWRSWASCFVMAAVIILVGQHMPTDVGLSSVLLSLLCKVGLGCVAYISCHFALWLISGRKDGLELVLIRRLGLLIGRRAHGAAMS
jgi:O-antigen/teichoic acid export membrane protein